MPCLPFPAVVPAPLPERRSQRLTHRHTDRLTHLLTDRLTPLLPVLLATLLIVTPFGQASAAPAPITDPLAAVLPGYAAVWREHGVDSDDYVVRRLGADGVPAELFRSPEGQTVDSVVIIDALSLLEDGFRVVTLSALTDRGLTTRVFHEDHRRLSAWRTPEAAPTLGQQHTALLATLAALEPISVAGMQAPGKPGIVHLPGPVLNRTYDSPVPTNPFAGYLGMVTLIAQGRITRQWPIAWFDLADPRAAVGNLRPVVPGRITLAMGGESAAAIGKAMDGRMLEIRIGAGDVTVVGNPLRTREDADRPMTDGWTPLMIATGRDRLALVRALLTLGADPGKVPAGGPSPLELAARLRFEPIALALLEHGAMPDPTPSVKGVRPVLTIASSHGNLVLVEALLKAGANPNRPVGIGATALTVAAAAPPHASQEAILRLLLASGADPHHLDSRCTATLDLLKRSNPALAERMGQELAVPMEKVQACRSNGDGGPTRR